MYSVGFNVTIDYTVSAVGTLSFPALELIAELWAQGYLRCSVLFPQYTVFRNSGQQCPNQGL